MRSPWDQGRGQGRGRCRGAGLSGLRRSGYHRAMRITCPTCDAAYDVPDARIAGGRAVRCARCGSDWVPLADTAPPPQALTLPDAVLPVGAALGQTVQAAPAATVAVPAATTLAFPAATMPPPIAPALPPSPAPARARPSPPILLAWTASFLLLGFLVWAGIAWRAGIMHAWPPSERLYAALGLLRGPPAR